MGCCAGRFFSASVVRGADCGSCALVWAVAICFAGPGVTVRGRVIGSCCCANAFTKNTNTRAMRIGAEGFFMIVKRGVVASPERSCKSDSPKSKLVVNDFFGQVRETELSHPACELRTLTRLDFCSPAVTAGTQKPAIRQPLRASISISP